MSFLFFALAGAVTLLSGCGNSNPSEMAVKADAVMPEDVFPLAAASNALTRTASFIRDCTPRDAGTPGAGKAAKWLASRLSAEGFTLENPFSPKEFSYSIDTFTNITPRGNLPFHNVLACIPAASPSSTWIVLLSHFDTMSGIVPRFDGANDGASSTALLLELAAWLKTHPLHHANVLCGWMDGEECMIAYTDHDGFHGSKRLARQMKDAKRDIRAVILMDMVGDKNLKITLPENGAASLRVLALEAAEAVGARDFIGLFNGYIYDDHQPFLELGYPTVDLIDFTYGSDPDENDYWHTQKDTMDKLSAHSLHITARIVLEMLRRL